ncbi:type II toxin-antitoxin system VapC family toxin [Brevundimonas sp. R86498]|uniref:type II toxin-antitoxin system VapC family toxin n=1 Tax=Brevundimonas sp. R86498 TaxID=3093845 RepID=UPI0037CA72BA
MIVLLADTSIWADHFRAPDPLMRQMLAHERVRMHPYVLGELCMGNLYRRPEAVEYLRALHLVAAVSDDEVMQMVEQGKLYGSGLSWVDAHLLTAVVLSPGLKLWTRDRRLNEAAIRFDRAAALHH